MNETGDRLRQRLKEATHAFFESHLRCTPHEVEVLRKQDFVVIRVRGFLTKAESELLKRPQEAKLLTNYYNGMLEGLYVPLEEVIRDTAQLALVEKQAVLEVEQEQCVLLLTLGRKPEACGKRA
jgi:uncharacterized protein YbcI